MPRFLRYKTPTGQVLEVEWSGKGEPTQEDIAYGRELAMREFQKTGPMQMGAYAGAKGQGRLRHVSPLDRLKCRREH